ncbi:MAG: hypothetical protein ACI4SY_07025 [Sutterella sp.]
MFVKKMLTGACALALMGLAAAAHAVSLGSLTVESRPGEPLDAVLEIDDLDLTISPLLVRVAPPATYLREGVAWPIQVQDLKMVRDSASSRVRLRIFGTQQIRSGSFPLLLEMNAGGTVTVRTYTISAEKNRFTVTPSPVKTTVAGQPKVKVPETLPAAKKTAAEPVRKAVSEAAATSPAKTQPKKAAAPEQKTEPSKTVKAEEPKAAKPASPKADEPAKKLSDMPAPKAAAEDKPRIMLPIVLPEKEKAETAAPARKAASAPEAKPEVKPDPKAVQKAEVSQKASPEPVKVEPKPAAKSEAKAEPKPASTPKAAPQAAPEVKPVAKTEAKSEPRPAAKSEQASETAVTAKQRRGRFAPNVVKEYVALNGFDASQPFKVQRDMTLWSVVKLYWPSYRGATLEQTLIGFRNRNAGAFVGNDLNRLETGSVLNPPKPEDVFAIDPMAAFREVHGTSETVPLVTQNLIDAQLVGGEVASLVADAQDRARAADRSVQEIAETGRKVLEEQKARIVREKTLVSADAGHPIGAPRESVSGVKAEAAPLLPAPEASPAKPVAIPEDKPKAEPAKQAQPEEPKTAAKPEAPKKQAKPEPKAEPVKVAEKPKAQAEPSDGMDRSQMIFWGIVAALVLALLAFFGFRRKREAEPDEGAAKPQTVLIQKDVAATTDAQLAGLKATVDEAVKNGTTAGAMGVGAAAYAEARKAEDAAKSGAVEGQPWIDPDDDELPPLEDEEKAPASAAAATPEQTKKAIESVSLDFDDEQAPEPKPAAQSAPRPAVHPAEPAKAPAEAPAKPSEPESVKEQALIQALDAKLKLASSFVGLGALKEALELLDEVKRRGSEDQRERARILEERIKSKPEAAK